MLLELREEHYVRFLREHGLIDKIRGVKDCVTGPFTLTSHLDSKNVMTCGTSKPNVVRVLAEILSRSCRRLSDLGFDLINIGEPFLSLMLRRENDLRSRRSAPVFCALTFRIVRLREDEGYTSHDSTRLKCSFNYP